MDGQPNSPVTQAEPLLATQTSHQTSGHPHSALHPHILFPPRETLPGAVSSFSRSFCQLQTVGSHAIGKHLGRLKGRGLSVFHPSLLFSSLGFCQRQELQRRSKWQTELRKTKQDLEHGRSLLRLKPGRPIEGGWGHRTRRCV